MSDQEEFEGEIEFLDEDAEIVQQCVSVPHVENKKYVEAEPDQPDSQASQASSTRMLYELLVERDDEKDEKSKRKRKHDDDDDDYDPKEDVLNPFYRKRKRRPVGPQNIQRERIVEFVPKPQIKNDPFDPKMDLGVRRKLQLKVPDYDDPLCLPVRALRKDPVELQKLRNWNNLCLEHFKRYDTTLGVDKQPTVASTRIVVLKNLPNGPNGKVETTMSAKLSVENKNGEKRTEVTQSVLPRYREKKLLNISLTKPKKSRACYNKEEVILTKEVQKGEESLVVYKPKDSLSLVYKMCDNKGDDQPSSHEEEDRRYLKEVASCKVCAPCYQTSWRAFKTANNNKKILCTICKRPCISMYNLLAHMKSHPNAAVRACKKEIAECLATAVEYHYKCKICEQKFTSIKALRSHVKLHKGTDNFRCEVCNQYITNQQIIINKM